MKKNLWAPHESFLRKIREKTGQKQHYYYYYYYYYYYCYYYYYSYYLVRECGFLINYKKVKMNNSLKKKGIIRQNNEPQL